jgi:hypothetical protein
MKLNGMGRRIWLVVMSVLIGAAYGMLIRFGNQISPESRAFWVMTLGFVLFLPFAIGFITVYVIERRQPQPVWMWLLLSWVAVTLAILGTVAVLWEGVICAVMLAPIGWVAGMAGGAVAGAWIQWRRSRGGMRLPMACVMILPLLVSSVEQQILASREVRTVESVIDIQAPVEVVWKQIERVPRIDRAELPPSWGHTIGFPNPVEATLSHEGVGGVRQATFEGGVLFVETIDVWEPQRRLGFSIHADAHQIPQTTLDEHVTVGGQFFDVLHGEYFLEPLPKVARDCIYSVGTACPPTSIGMLICGPMR